MAFLKGIAWPVLLPLLFLIFFLPSLPEASRVAQITPQALGQVEHVCRSHDDYYFCRAALESDPGSASADLTGLGFISLRSMKDNVTDTTVLIRSELGREKDAQKVKSLNACLEAYRQAAEDTEDGTRALTAKDYHRMSVEALAVGSSAEGCDRALGGGGGANSPQLRVRNRNLDRLSEIAWVIAVMLR